MQKRIETISVLVIATIGLLFVGLLAVAGFTVLVQRRQRALGMLAAVGATDRNVKLVMIANGFIVGTVGAVLGVAVGLTGWVAFAPTFEHIAEHRIDRFSLAWWAVLSAVGLAIGTATLASWWPARAASRLAIVSALSGRPAPPRPAHRFAVVGVALGVAGYMLLVLSHQRSPIMVIAGVVATTLGTLFIAPLGLKVLASAARHLPVAGRLALRDLARYQARSGSAVAAISLAIGIAATITVAAASNAATHQAAFGNLPADALMIRTQPDVGPLAELTADELATIRSLASSLAASVGSSGAIELDLAMDPQPIDGRSILVGGSSTSAPRHEVAMLGKVIHHPHGTEISGGLEPYAATPQLLAALGIPASSIDPTKDLITSRTDLGGMSLLAGRTEHDSPSIQLNTAFPHYTSEPSTLITPQAMQRLGLVPAPTSWLIKAPHALTRAQIADAIHHAAAAGVSIETRKDSVRSLAQLRDWSTGIGILAALAVLAMTVGLIRAETAQDVRTLAATGASGLVRRGVTAATAAALGMLGAVIGTSAAYLALLAWNYKRPGTLAHVPAHNLVAILIGLPLVAAFGGWLLGGREPEGLGRKPVD